MFKKVKWLPLLVLFILSSIQLSMGSNNANRPDNDVKQIEAFKSEFIDIFWKINPVSAIYSGFHKYDSIPVVYNEKFFQFRKKSLIELQAQLTKFDIESMEPSNKVEFYMMRDRIESELWYQDVFKEYEWNPAYYNIGGEYVQILNSQHAPLEAKLRTIAKRLRGAESYFSSARKNLTDPVIEHTDLAIIQNEGSLYIFEKLIADSIRKSKLNRVEAEELKNLLLRTTEIIKAHVSYLNDMKSKLNEETSRSFRIGDDMYRQKFNHDINSRFTADEIYERALVRKEELTANMIDLSKKLWSKYMKDSQMPEDDRQVVRIVLDQISDNHVAAGDFISAIEKQIPALEKFVREKDLLYLDPEKPLVVRQTPGYMEGSGAGASISAPGPYNSGQNTYYNVSPLTGYGEDEAKSFLKEYNNYTLQILNIHEAIPGHYAQLVYANRTQGILKSILENGAMIEGWAVYAERMMLEEGYGENSPEMWLMYNKWHLRSVCNTILDYSVHVFQWPEKVATGFLSNEAFQENAEVMGKWKRAKLTSVQLCSYFTGYTEIYDLREELKARAGEGFSLKGFHESFLSHGSAPVKYIRELMIEGQ